MSGRKRKASGAQIDETAEPVLSMPPAEPAQAGAMSGQTAQVGGTGAPSKKRPAASANAARLTSRMNNTGPIQTAARISDVPISALRPIRRLPVRRERNPVRHPPLMEPD